ncbi:hypothetical protein BH11PSE3_BH11PSE3_49670 [soil metagenome]
MANTRSAKLKQAAYRSIKSALARMGCAVVRTDTLTELLEHAHVGRYFEGFHAILNGLSVEHELPADLIAKLRYSTSQFQQDLFALSQVGFKRGGYFVEFGAADGLSASNTHLLEKAYGWTGILAEPARAWHDDLRRNRPAARIETDCVWSRSGVTLAFDEVDIAEFSSIDQYSADNFRHSSRPIATQYSVATISLNDLLEKYRAPEVIDFLSIDTEGSEFEILSHFDFSRHRFNAIVCEHNYSPMRERVLELLTARGYGRKFPELSRVDDWYAPLG